MPNGIAGTGLTLCSQAHFPCTSGTVSATSDGGRSWRVLVRTRRPVVAVRFFGAADFAMLDDGETLESGDGGRSWAPYGPGIWGVPGVPCDPFTTVSPNQVVVVGGTLWALCVGEAGTGNQGKSVWRYSFQSHRWKRLAWTPIGGISHGGISSYGYPQGITMATGGFGLIWEARGTLYVTRDGGSNWVGLPKVAQPEVDFGRSAVALPGRVGFVLLARDADQAERLLETHDAGLTWEVVHRWP